MLVLRYLENVNLKVYLFLTFLASSLLNRYMYKGFVASVYEEKLMNSCTTTLVNEREKEADGV